MFCTVNFFEVFETLLLHSIVSNYIFNCPDSTKICRPDVQKDTSSASASWGFCQIWGMREKFYDENQDKTFVMIVKIEEFLST